MISADRSPPSPYRSFWMAGFEGADHINGSGNALDLVASNDHHRQVENDFRAAVRLGFRTVRESIGWRLSERAGGARTSVMPRFDFARPRRVADAAQRQGVQVLWSLMHYGMPADVSVFDGNFCERFAEFAAAAARALRSYGDAPPVYTPINEINFLAWALTESDLMHPYRRDSLQHAAARAGGKDLGFEVKCKLVQASLAAIAAIRREDPRARFLHVEPIIQVVAPVHAAHRAPEAADVSSWQWQAWDMLAGTLRPELGGSAEALDLIGVNYYHNCQWELDGPRLEWHLRDPRRVPFAALLRKAWKRYDKPLIVAETSHVGVGRAEWVSDVAAEVGRARTSGVPVQGICIYPLIDRPDWSTPDHWHQSGLLDVTPTAGEQPMRRTLNRPYAKALLRAQRRPLLSASSTSTSTMPHLIVFSHLRWNFVFQRPQHLLSRLAARFPVVFIEEPMRTDGPPWIERSSPVPGVQVLRPHTPVDAPGFHDDQLSVLEPMIVDWLADEGVDDYAAWFYTPMALPLLQELAPRAVIYDCMDELAAFKGAPRQMRQRETVLLKTADVVLTGGPSLYEAKRTLNKNVLCLPSAVDATHYSARRARADQGAMARAAQLQGHIASPRLGFFGVIDERLDIGLVAALADADPRWQIVMVGPVVKIDPAGLPQRPNLHWLGQQPYELLPQLVAGWDVCLMPFAMNESTRFISPTKTLEYMAAGKPVASTPIHDVVKMFGDVVAIADDAPTFIQACAEALAETAGERAAREVAMARSVARYSWDETAGIVGEAISGALRKAPRTAIREDDAIEAIEATSIAAVPLPSPAVARAR